MSLKIIDITVDALESLENPIPAVNHMIVYRDGHKKGVGDHTPQNTVVHSQIILMIGSNKFLCQTLAVLQIQVAQGHVSLLFSHREDKVVGVLWSLPAIGFAFRRGGRVCDLFGSIASCNHSSAGSNDLYNRESLLFRQSFLSQDNIH
jgi:hypothetical protein